MIIKHYEEAVGKALIEHIKRKVSKCKDKAKTLPFYFPTQIWYDVVRSIHEFYGPWTIIYIFYGCDSLDDTQSLYVR